jgi:hypothetical protein
VKPAADSKRARRGRKPETRWERTGHGTNTAGGDAMMSRSKTIKLWFRVKLPQRSQRRCGAAGYDHRGSLDVRVFGKAIRYTSTEEPLVRETEFWHPTGCRSAQLEHVRRFLEQTPIDDLPDADWCPAKGFRALLEVQIGRQASSTALHVSRPAHDDCSIHPTIDTSTRAAGSVTR